MIRNWGVSDYWKAGDHDGVWHIDTRGPFEPFTLCGRYDEPSNRPGTVGQEQHVTCILCAALFARTSKTPTPGSST